MKYYKDDCHHYKVINKACVITITLLGGHESSMSYENYSYVLHPAMDSIADKKVKPCTKKEFDTAFDKALNTINNLK